MCDDQSSVSTGRNEGPIMLPPGAEGAEALAARAVLATSRFRKCRRVILPTLPWNKDLSTANKLLMLPNFIRYPVCARNVFAPKNNFTPRRNFSIIAVHTSFPASLYRFQPRRNSGLFDYKPDGDIEDGLKVSADGLVYPRVSDDVPCWCCLSCHCSNSDVS